MQNLCTRITSALLLVALATIAPCAGAQSRPAEKRAVTEDGHQIIIDEQYRWRYAPLPAAPVTDMDGNTYRTRQYGDRNWMVENLRTTRLRTGEPLATFLALADWINRDAPATAPPNGDSTLVPTYGRLYNWFAVNAPGGLCPAGWSVPTRKEWAALISETNRMVSQAMGQPVSSNGALWLRSADDGLWAAPALNNNVGAKPFNYEFKDPVGFSARPAGGRARANGENYSWTRKLAVFYTSEISSKDDPYFFQIFQLGAQHAASITTYDGNNPKDSRDFGQSVRCIQDVPPVPPFRTKE